MIVIGSRHLTVNILDPRVDADKLGSRYCAGGYIWQIYENYTNTSKTDVRQNWTRDKTGRALLSGPRYPSPTPPPFDGQGMPEVFETPLGGGDCEVGGDVCVIGVGLVRKSSGIEPFHPRNNPHVIKPCLWDIDIKTDRVVMVAEQVFENKSIRLRREVRVADSRVESITAINNVGAADVSLRWFPHPFFPINPNLTCGRIDPFASLPENAGYEIGPGGVIRMKRDYPWEKGLFLPLNAPQTKLLFTVPHPFVGAMILKPGYNVARCPLWANSQTFSFEPFNQLTIKPGDAAAWTVSLIFTGFDVGFDVAATATRRV